MAEFKSKFNGSVMGHRFKMLQLMNGLALEINTTLKIGSRRRSLVTHAKEIGWLDRSYLVRQKREALRDLVEQATQGFGYVPNASVKRAMAPVVAKATEKVSA